MNPNPDRPLRGRRISWAEFTALTGQPKPDYAALAANDNRPVSLTETERPQQSVWPSQRQPSQDEQKSDQEGRY